MPAEGHVGTRAEPVGACTALIAAIISSSTVSNLAERSDTRVPCGHFVQHVHGLDVLVPQDGDLVIAAGGLGASSGVTSRQLSRVGTLCQLFELIDLPGLRC